MEPSEIKAGEDVYEEYMGQPLDRRGAIVGGELYDLTLGHVFGKVWSRPGLGLRDRALITIALLAAAGREEELRIHIHGALNQGIDRDAIREVMIHTAHYSGWPSGVGGTRVAESVFEALDARDSSA